MSNKRACVLGSNSFAGSQLVSQLLIDGFDVVGINRSQESSDIFLPYKNCNFQDNYQFYQLDINKNFDDVCDLIGTKQPSFVFDLAGQGMVAESWNTPEQWYQTNIIAKVKLHQFLRQVSSLEKYIRVSTPEVYGSHDSLSQESKVYSPSTPYAVSHAAIDMSLETFFRQYDFPVIFTRFSNFYGPGQQLYRIIPRTIIYALTGRTLELHGGGTAIRAFINGIDVGKGLIKVAHKGTIGDVYHFSTNDFISIRELVELIYQRLNLNFHDHVRVVADRPGKDANYLMDDAKAQRELEWKPTVSLIEGIDQSIAWVRANLEEIKTLELNYKHKE